MESSENHEGEGIQTQTSSALRQSARCDAAGDSEVVRKARFAGSYVEDTSDGQVPDPGAFKQLLGMLGQQYESDIEEMELKLRKALADLSDERDSQRYSVAVLQQEDVILPNSIPVQDPMDTGTRDAWNNDEGSANADSPDGPRISSSSQMCRGMTSQTAISSQTAQTFDTQGEGLGRTTISNPKKPRQTAMRMLNVMRCWDMTRDSIDACETDSFLQKPATPMPKEGERSNVLVIRTTTFMRHFITYPSTPTRLAWDIAGAVLIFYDLLNIPLSVFGRRREVLFMVCMDWFSMLFWTINVGMTLTVGYLQDGVMIMDPTHILINYLKTWFVVDLIVVVPDWIFTIASLTSGQDDGAEAGGSLKMLRILRLVRMVRLVRLFKLRKIMRLINDLIDSEYLSIFANIAKMLLSLLIMCHLIGCIWFALGQVEDRNDTWIRIHRFDDEDIGWLYQYTTSLHWSITQFTPASMHLQPQNVYERIYAIAIVVFGLVVFSYVVGSITSSLGQLRGMQEDAHKQFWHLRRYLKQNKIDKVLAHRLQKYLEHAWQSRKERLQAKDIKIFGLLSEQLHSELVFSIEEPHLKVHPLFAQLSKTSNMTMHRIAKRAISNKMVARTDKVFIPGEKATHMAFVTLGTLHYYSSLAEDENVEPEIVESAEDWISEPVLWTSVWIHRGGLVAETEAELTLINPKAFEEVIHLSPPALSLTCTYACNFIVWANKHLHDLSDISQGEDVSQMCIEFMELEDENQRIGMQKQLSVMFKSAGTKTKSLRSYVTS